jgi:hypothetical protein
MLSWLLRMLFPREKNQLKLLMICWKLPLLEELDKNGPIRDGMVLEKRKLKKHLKKNEHDRLNISKSIK